MPISPVLERWVAYTAIAGSVGALVFGLVSCQVANNAENVAKQANTEAAKANTRADVANSIALQALALQRDDALASAAADATNIALAAYFLSTHDSKANIDSNSYAIEITNASRRAINGVRLDVSPCLMQVDGVCLGFMQQESVRIPLTESTLLPCSKATYVVNHPSQAPAWASTLASAKTDKENYTGEWYLSTNARWIDGTGLEWTAPTSSPQSVDQGEWRLASRMTQSWTEGLSEIPLTNAQDRANPAWAYFAGIEVTNLGACKQ